MTRWQIAISASLLLMAGSLAIGVSRRHAIDLNSGVLRHRLYVAGIPISERLEETAFSKATGAGQRLRPNWKFMHERYHWPQQGAGCSPRGAAPGKLDLAMSVIESPVLNGEERRQHLDELRRLLAADDIDALEKHADSLFAMGVSREAALERP